MDVTFSSPIFLWFLLLMPLLVAVHFYSLHFAKQKAMRFANFEALEKVLQTTSVVPNNYAILAMRILTLAFFTLAAAGMTFHYDATTAAYDYVIAIDTSSSMMAQDLQPTRIDATLRAVTDWSSTVPYGAKVGLVHFSSQAQSVLAPTPVMLSVAWAAKSIAPEKSGGTAICEAIRASVNQFQFDEGESPRAVVLISDGQNNAGCPLEEGVAYAKAQNVTVFSIGVGSEAGGEVENLPGIKFTLDEADLKRAAEGTGGKYFRAAGPGQLYDALAFIGKNAVRSEAVPLSVPIMVLAFALVFVDWGLSITRYRTIP